MRVFRESSWNSQRGALRGPRLIGRVEAVHATQAEIRATAEDPLRLRALHFLEILDTRREERFDRLVRIAQRHFGVPMVAINFIDADRQWTKAEAGLPGQTDELLSESMCAHTVHANTTLVVPDTSTDDRFRNGKFVADGARFYAGHPLRAPGGQPIGSLCILDTRPRELSDQEQDDLADLAALVEREVALTNELDRAAYVQQMLMPREAPDLPGYELAGLCVPARDIGGDFYAWQLLGDGKLQVHVSDVMGKGIPAALLAASMRTAVLGAAQFNDQSMAVAKVASVAETILGSTETFATLFSGRLDPASGTLEYIDAGHGLALILEADGGFRRLQSSGLPIGLLPADTWELHQDRLAPGEMLVVVTDGILDLFPRLEAAIDYAVEGTGRQTTAASFVAAAVALAETEGAQDDVTVLALRRR